MSKYTIRDNANQSIKLPEPVYRKVHQFSDYDARYENFSYSISEVMYPSFVLLSIVKCDVEWKWVATEHLLAMVQHLLEINPGLTIKNLSDSNALLVKEKQG